VEEYLGIGIAAHSYMQNKRFANTTDIDEYIFCLGSGKTVYNTIEEVDETQKEIEYIMLKLRLKKGFLLTEYKKNFSKDFKDFYALEIDKLKKAKLISLHNGRIYATKKGFDFQNTIVLELTQNL